MRLQKVIANSGYCSRRAAEKLIREGVVTVNSKVAGIGLSVTDSDDIRIDGKPLKKQSQKIYIALNKPKGYTCTNRRFKDEKNIFELVDVDERLFVVGRLDKNSRGLVILTNDGDYAQKTTHPSFEHEKTYLVTIQDLAGNSAQEIIKKMQSGFMDEDEFLTAKKVTYLGNNKFKITLTEGKKRHLRRMFASLGLKVTNLIRTSIGKVKLGELKEGKWQEIKKPV